MPGDVVGKAVFQLETDTTGVQRGLDATEKKAKATGAAVEGAFGSKSQTSAKGLNAQLTAIGQRFEHINKQGGLAKSILGGVGLGGGILAFNAIKEAIGGVVDVFVDLAKKAMEEQVGIDRLTAALRANIPAWDGNTRAIEDAIKAGVDLAFTADDQRAALALLVAQTHSVTSALDILRTAMDLSRLKGVGLNTTALVLGKAWNGNTTSLKKFGIQVDKGARGMEALGAVQKVVTGQAAAYADTTAGSFESLQASVDLAQAEIGTKLLPVMRDLAIFARDQLVPAILQGVDALSLVGDVVNLIAMIGRADPGAVAAAQRLGERIAKGLNDGVNKGMGRRSDLDALGAGITDTVDHVALEYGKSVKLIAQSNEDLTKSMAPLAGVVTAAWEDVAKKTKHGIRHSLKATVHNELSAARKQATLDTAAYHYALTHPLAGKKLEDFYHTQLTTALKRLRRAEHRGATQAIAVAQADVDKYTALLAEMTAADTALSALMWKQIVGTGILQGVIAKFKPTHQPKPGDHRGPGGPSGGQYSGSGGAGQATGGYRPAGYSGMWGERGPEHVRLLSNGGAVTSASQGSNANGIGGTLRVVHEISASGAAALRSAGYSPREVGAFMIATPDQAISRWRSQR